jgi:hypothetical protein
MSEITAAHVAVALVAACKITGIGPEDVFKNGEGGGRTRVMAAAACVARLGVAKPVAGRLFQVHTNRLTPSGLAIAKVTTDHLLSISEALSAHGLLPGSKESAPSSPSPSSNQTSAAAAVAPQRKADPVAKRSRPVRASPPTTRVVRLKPVNARILGWTRQQLAKGADLSFVADCFDVDPNDLAQALDPMETAA